MTPWVCDPIDIKRFVDGGAKPKAKFLYYYGSSLQDSLLATQIGKLAYQASQKGYVYLVQKRIRSHEYEYYMIKASRYPAIKLVPLTDEKLAERYRHYVRH